MKTLAYLILLFSIVFLSARCEAPVVFSEAQPVGEEAKTAFELRYQGTYFCEVDSAWVEVTPYGMYKEKVWSLALTKAEIDSMQEVRWVGEQLYLEPLAQYVDVKYHNDSLIYADVTMTDTLFRLEEGKILKYYRGHQVLNFKKNSGNWEVWVLTLDGLGNLSVAKAEIPDDLKKLESITEVKDIGTPDRPQLQLSPSRTEFRKLLHSDMLFKECDYFIRIARQTSL